MYSIQIKNIRGEWVALGDRTGLSFPLIYATKKARLATERGEGSHRVVFIEKIATTSHPQKPAITNYTVLGRAVVTFA